MVTPFPYAAPAETATLAAAHIPASAGRGGLRFALPLVIGAFAIVLAGVNSTVFDLERHAVPKALALHATALLCLPWLLFRGRSIAPGIVELLLGAFVLVSAASALFATNRWLAFHALGISASGLVLLLAARRAAASGTARNAVLAALGAAATLAAFLGAAQAYGLQLEWLARERAPGGTFGNRNFLAHLVVIATPILLLGAARIRRSAIAILPLVALAICTGAVILTRSRAAWLAMTVSLLVMTIAAAVARRTHPGLLPRRRPALLLAVIAAGALLAIALPNRLAWRSDAPYAETFSRLTDFETGSGRGRIIQWENSLSLAAEAPVLGLGPGNWFVHYPRVTSPGDPSFAGADPIPTNPWPSSDWIAFLVERGLAGTAFLLLAGLSAATVAAVRILRRSAGAAEIPPEAADLPNELPDEPGGPEGSRHAAADAARGVAFLGMLAATAVAGAFDAVLLLPAPTFLFWTAAGLLLPGTRAVFTWRTRVRWRRLAWGLTLAVQVALVLVTVGQLAAIRIIGDRPSRERLDRAARFDPGGHRVRLLLAQRGSCAERLRHARAAAALMPHHPSPRRLLAACGERPAP